MLRAKGLILPVHHIYGETLIILTVLLDLVGP